MSLNFRSLLDSHTNYLEEINKIIDSRRHIVFFGCGGIFRNIVDTWHEYVARPIDYCCDNDPKKWGKLFNDIPCISPLELEKIKDDAAVFVTIGNFRPVFEQLSNQGFRSVNLLFKYDLVTSAYLNSQPATLIGECLQQTYDNWADQRSREVFSVIVKRAIGGERDINLMPSICEDDQYFVPEIVQLDENEDFVDVGAYDGDTVTGFISAAKGKFHAIHALELDKNNFGKLIQTIPTLPQHERIHAYNVGAWHEKARLAFKTEETSSRLGNGDAMADVMPLDELLYGLPVSFIKMDIEGAEPQALQGAQAIIRNQRPKLAICVYHHISHLWEIPAYIRQLSPDYKLYLRHHTNLEYETVCYAIPPSR